jgi:hypothetical protein
VAHFVVQSLRKSLKENPEKRKTVVFRKRISAKIAVFSAFKSVKRVDKKRRYLDRAPQARARIVI